AGGPHPPAPHPPAGGRAPGGGRGGAAHGWGRTPPARRWRDRTTGTFRLRVFPGDHFYLNPRLTDVADTVRTVLAEPS
ncbi:thioesterase domain-containing protein, partial [Streptomyces sp. NPDC058861]|uniref:thioesterase domain-containing protein n=1 Tax=Streptomyces sp. NPDC058861 TaxID=3346653 RepID=UPI0036B9F5DA